MTSPAPNAGALPQARVGLVATQPLTVSATAGPIPMATSGFTALQRYSPPSSPSLSLPDVPRTTSEYTLISTPDHIAKLLPTLVNLPTSPPSLYLDLEGINLCRDGTISLITLYVYPHSHTYLIDIHTLSHLAFSTPSATDPSVTLKSIIESPAIPLVLFDLRNDNDALANLFNVRMQGVFDIQLMELACRTRYKDRLWGLAKTIRIYGGLSSAEWQACDAIKILGKRLFAPEEGGSYQVFNQRPLSNAVAAYCVADVKYLVPLWQRFNAAIIRGKGVKWNMLRTSIETETQRRLAHCDEPGYQPRGADKVLAPVGFF